MIHVHRFKLIDRGMFCFRCDIGGRLGAGPDTQPVDRFVLKSNDELLAENSVISTFRVSSAEPARAPGQPGPAINHDPTYCYKLHRRPRIVLMYEDKCWDSLTPV